MNTEHDSDDDLDEANDGEEMATPDGHPFEDLDVVFAVMDAAALRTYLDGASDLRKLTDSWEWTLSLPGNDEPAALAWLYLEDEALLVQCIARAHAETLRARFSELPAGLCTYRETVGADD